MKNDKVKRVIYHYSAEGKNKSQSNNLYDNEFANEYDIDDRQLELQKKQDKIINRSAARSINKTSKKGKTAK